jgi:hypothetical protein
MQVWTEAVHEDATFVVINSGTYEIIGIRDRATQTLYITGVIMTTASTCNYGKLHTGLFIAAIRDARGRSLRLRNSSPYPDSWTASYSLKKLRNICMVRAFEVERPNIVLSPTCETPTRLVGVQYSTT